MQFYILQNLSHNHYYTVCNYNSDNQLKKTLCKDIRTEISSLSVSSGGRQARISFVLIEIHLPILLDSPYN